MDEPSESVVNDDPGLLSLPLPPTAEHRQFESSRAGLYVYLTGVLHDRPRFDDECATKLLGALYGGNTAAAVQGLIVGAFDTLANVIARHESNQARILVRSFIVNRVPLFLDRHFSAALSAAGSVSMVDCIRSTSNTINQLSSQSFDLISETRQDFLFACALHDLLPESSIEQILGDVPMQSLPAAGQYQVANVRQSMIDDSSACSRYIAELEKIEGNAGAIAHAALEVLRHACEEKNMTLLTTLCLPLLTRPMRLDTVLLFVSPEELARPVCDLLADWTNPGGESYSCAVLLLATLRSWYRIDQADLDNLSGKSSPSKISCYLNQRHRSLDKLSSSESELLKKWIAAMIDSNAANGQILMAGSPIEHSSIILTCFEQCIEAGMAGLVSKENFKTGLQQFHRPDLLQFLLSCVPWLIERIWELNQNSDHEHITFLLQILLGLVRPGAQMSRESLDMHRAVLTALTSDLGLCVRHLQQKFPQLPESQAIIDTLMPILQPHDEANEKRQQDIRDWIAAPSTNDLLSSLSNTIQSLSMWSSIGASTSMPAPPILVAHQIDTLREIKGADAVIRCMIDEVCFSTMPDIVLDIVATLILTSEHKLPKERCLSQTPTIPLTLFGALQLRCEEASETAKTDLGQTNIILRLNARILAFNGQEAMPESQALLQTSNDQMLSMQTYANADMQASASAQIDAVIANV